MLRKSGSIQKDQNMAAAAAAAASGTHQMNNNNSVFRVAGLFLGQGPKALSDCDSSVMSPTSPLDFKKFSTTSKVGLSIVDSLDNNSGPALDGKNIVFGPQLRIRTSNLSSQFDSVFVSKSLPTTDHQLIPPNKGKSLDTSIFEIADALESEAKSEFIRACPFGSSRPFIITGIPKSNLHISGCTDVSHLITSSDFLSFCYSCSKELAGKDIYIYRGEKAFCSPSCRELEMEDDEKMEDTNNSHPDCTEPEP
ncbi:unnamed protein product [Rhodiola kirilowii]